MTAPVKQSCSCPEPGLQEQPSKSAGTILLMATKHIACLLLGGSIGRAISPHQLSDSLATVLLVYVWLVQLATAGYLLITLASSLTASFTAAIVGAAVVTLHLTLTLHPENGAIWMFWIWAGAYVGLAVEASSGLVGMLEDSMAQRIEKCQRDGPA